MKPDWSLDEMVQVIEEEILQNEKVDKAKRFARSFLRLFKPTSPALEKLKEDA